MSMILDINGTRAGSFDLQPITTRIFIKRQQVDKVGSIYIPSSTKSMEMSEGDVIGVGDDCHIVKLGDYVVYGKYAGAEIERNGHKVTVINEEDIIAIVKKEI